MLKKHLLLSIVFGITLTACGGGGSSSTSTAGNPTPTATPTPTPAPTPTPTSITSLSVGTAEAVLPTFPNGVFPFLTGLTTTDDGGYQLFWQEFSSANGLFSQAFSPDGAPVGEQITGSVSTDSIEVLGLENAVIQSGDTLYHHFIQTNLADDVGFSTFRGPVTQDIANSRDNYTSIDDLSGTLFISGFDLAPINGNQLISTIRTNDVETLENGDFVDTSDVTSFIISPNGTASEPINIVSDAPGFGFEVFTVTFDDSFGVAFEVEPPIINDTFEPDSILFQRASLNGAILGEPITIAVETDQDNFVNLGDAAPLSDGTALIVWSDESSGGTVSNIKARVIDSAGSFVTEEFQVNDSAIDVENDDPQIIPLANGQALIVWEREGDQADENTESLIGRVINADGTLSSDETILVPDSDELSGGFGVQLDDGSIILAADNMVLDITPVIGN